MNIDYTKPFELVSNVFDLVDGKLVTKEGKEELLKELYQYPIPVKV